jgi:hypothetical protein
MWHCLFRNLKWAVVDEADGPIDWAALQYQYIQARLAAELASIPTGFQGEQPSTEQHVMATPHVMESKTKKFLKLRKALSTVHKACKAALSCFGKKDM